MLLINWPKQIKQSIIFVRYNRVFVMTKFVITEFHCYLIWLYVMFRTPVFDVVIKFFHFKGRLKCLLLPKVKKKLFAQLIQCLHSWSVAGINFDWKKTIIKIRSKKSQTKELIVFKLFCLLYLRVSPIYNFFLLLLCLRAPLTEEKKLLLQNELVKPIWLKIGCTNIKLFF